MSLEATFPRRRLDAEIPRVSGIMEWLLGAAVVLSPLALAAYAFEGGRLTLSHPWAADLGVSQEELSPGYSTTLFAALFLATAPLLWGLWRLSKMFAAFGLGRVFTVSAAQEFERFCWALAATAFAQPLASAFFGIVLRMSGFPLRPSVTVYLSSTDLVALLLGVALAVVAKVMRMAAHLAQENSEYV